MDVLSLPSVICHSIKVDAHLATLLAALLWTAEDEGDRLAQADSQEVSAKMVWEYLDIMALWRGQQGTWLTP